MDMQFFKEKTTGHCVIIGRKNYDSIPDKFRPLKNRTNIVISKALKSLSDGSILVHSIEDAITTAKQTGDNEIFIIGGAEIYRQTISICDRIYLTLIHHTFDGDAFFPELNKNEWKETERRKGIVDDKNIYPHDFLTYDRMG